MGLAKATPAASGEAGPKLEWKVPCKAGTVADGWRSQVECASLLGVSVRMNREGRGSNEVAREAPDQVGQERQGPQPIIAGEVHLTPQLLIEDDCQVRWQALPSRGPRPLVRGI